MNKKRTILLVLSVSISALISGCGLNPAGSYTGSINRNCQGVTSTVQGTMSLANNNGMLTGTLSTQYESVMVTGNSNTGSTSYPLTGTMNSTGAYGGYGGFPGYGYTGSSYPTTGASTPLTGTATISGSSGNKTMALMISGSGAMGTCSFSGTLMSNSQ